MLKTHTLQLFPSELLLFIDMIELTSFRNEIKLGGSVMTYFENVKIFTEDNNLRERILKKYSDKYYHFPEVKENILYIRNKEGQTHQDLLELSLLYKAQIVAQYSFESDRYALTQEVRINDGKEELLDIQVNYYFDFADEFKLYVETESQNQIFDRLKKFYQSIDTVNIYEDGKYDFDLNEDKEVIINLIIDNYEVSAIKIGNEIEITHFKYCK